MKPNYIKYSLSILLFVGVFLFLGFLHPEIMFFHENNQMFLYDNEYFTQYLPMQEGICVYISEYLTQFYYYPIIGAAIVAALFVAIQVIMNWIFKIFGVDNNLYPLSFLPSLFLWYKMCDPNYMLCFDVAILINILLFASTYKLDDKIGRQIIPIFLSLILYWITGPAAIIVALLFAVRNYKKYKYAVLIPLPLLIIEALIFSNFVYFPLKCFFWGFNYLRTPLEDNLHIIALILLALLPWIASMWKKEISTKKSYIISSILLVSTAIIIPISVNTIVWKTVKMYNLIYNKNWDGAIAFFDKNQIYSLPSIQSMNLALANKGILTEKMFHYNQPTSEALVSDNATNNYLTLVNCEIFYSLGAFNISQRYAFESQENLLRHSSKISLRLAQTAIINGEYPVARKYLMNLAKTKFYKETAKNYLKILNDEKNVQNYPEFAQAQQIKLETDGTQSDLETEFIYENLLKKNRNNKLALQYLQAHSLLNLDAQKLYESINKYTTSDVLPRHIQEALVLYYHNKNKTLNNIPKYISQDVVNAFEIKNFDNTFWKYVISVNNAK